MTPARQPTVVFAFAEPRRASRQMFLLLPNLGEPANDCFLSCKPLASQPTFVFSLASCLRASQRLFSLLQAACEQANVCFLSCKLLASKPTFVFSLASRLRVSQRVFSLLQAACEPANRCYTLYIYYGTIYVTGGCGIRWGRWMPGYGRICRIVPGRRNPVCWQSPVL